jgi:hypothetical protein
MKTLTYVINRFSKIEYKCNNRNIQSEGEYEIVLKHLRLMMKYITEDNGILMIRRIIISVRIVNGYLLSDDETINITKSFIKRMLCKKNIYTDFITMDTLNEVKQFVLSRMLDHILFIANDAVKHNEEHF